jgi:hypothetical protein
MLKQTRWTLVTTACAAALVGVLVGRFTSGSRPPAPASVATNPQADAARRVEDPLEQAASADSAAVEKAAHDAEEIEICGLGFVPADEAAAVLQNGPGPAPEVVARVSDALRASAAPPARALGTWLPAVDATERVMIAANSQLQRCGDDKACVESQRGATLSTVRQAGQPGVDALARQAADSEDAAVYAMAVQACGTSYPRLPATGNCQLINLERWAQLDPDNAVPWTHLVSAALSRNDANGADEALYRASIASSSRLVGDSLLAIAGPALATGLSDVERTQIASTLIGMQTTWTLPPFVAPMKMCSDEALRDGNRRQTCEAYASMLLDKGTTVAERSVGIRLGERLRWPAERLEALRKERAALAFATVQNGPSPGGLFSCEARKRAIDMAVRSSALGELARARATITASGKSVDEWARLGRERPDAAAEAASSAASSASPVR